MLGGKPTVFAGSWHGSFYGLQGHSGLFARLEDQLPVSSTGSDQCVIRKVRSGAVAFPDGNGVDLMGCGPEKRSGHSDCITRT